MIFGRKSLLPTIIVIASQLMLFASNQNPLAQDTTKIAVKPVVVMTDDVPKLVADKKLLLERWNQSLIENSVEDASLSNAYVINIDGKHYLQATGSKYTSTIELNTDGPGWTRYGSVSAMLSATVSCTSAKCNKGTGCTPKGADCTRCSLGTCTRTTTSFDLFDQAVSLPGDFWTNIEDESASDKYQLEFPRQLEISKDKTLK